MRASWLKSSKQRSVVRCRAFGRLPSFRPRTAMTRRRRGSVQGMSAPWTAVESSVSVVASG